MFLDGVALENKTEVGEHVGGLLREVVTFNRVESRVIGGERFAFPIQEGQHTCVVSIRESGIINFKAIHDGRLLATKILDSLSKINYYGSPIRLTELKFVPSYKNNPPYQPKLINPNQPKDPRLVGINLFLNYFSLLRPHIF